MKIFEKPDLEVQESSKTEFYLKLKKTKRKK